MCCCFQNIFYKKLNYKDKNKTEVKTKDHNIFYIKFICRDNKKIKIKKIILFLCEDFSVIFYTKN